MDISEKPSEFTCSEKWAFPVIFVSGYFDERLVSEISATIDDYLKNGKISIIIDLSKCVAINSLAVGQLQFMAMKIVDDFQGNLIFTKVSPVIMRVFELAGIFPDAKNFPEISQAVSYLQNIK